MKHLKQLLCAITLITSLILHAQDSDKGIHWTTGLSWAQVKEKAKKENKYIFLDCYTTWCGPCKMMDQLVYVNDTVGQLMNDKFISVRVQMDKTKGDNENVQAWYKDANEISKRYFVEGYPTILFFSPEGAIVNKGLGYKVVDSFLNVAKVALEPGRKFNDDYAIYQNLKADYDQGNIHYDQLIFMVTMGKKMRDSAIVHKLLKSQIEYVSKLKSKKRYTKENIEFWSTLHLSETSPIVHFFSDDSKIIDKIMGIKGYAAKQVDKCIHDFIAGPFVNKSLKDPKSKSTSTMFDSTGRQIFLKGNSDEASWDSLYQVIKKSFNDYYAKRDVLITKVFWYERNRNWIPYAENSLKLLKQFPPHLKKLNKFPPDEHSLKDPYDMDILTNATQVNQTCWNIFLTVNDNRILNEAIRWSKKVVDVAPGSDYLDTYANLLYKMGRKAEAIQWEEKAVALITDPGDQRFHNGALEQMKKGGPTYGVTPLALNK